MGLQMEWDNSGYKVANELTKLLIFKKAIKKTIEAKRLH